MPSNRYFIDLPLILENTYELQEAEWHHLVNVSRAKIDDEIELVNGKGTLARGLIKRLNKRSVEIVIQNVHTEINKKPELILALAIQKKNHLEWILEKGTELNATSFWLFPGVRSEKVDFSPSQLQRLKLLTISAMKQCGRLDLPSIELKPPLLQFTPLTGTLLFGDVSSKAPKLWQLSLPKPPSLPVILFVGPERGFTPEEELFLKEKLKGIGVSLHSNILRAETAPLVGLSLIQTLF